VHEVSFRARPHHNVHRTLGSRHKSYWPFLEGGLYRMGEDRDRDRGVERGGSGGTTITSNHGFLLVVLY
jgi:hypothetical protein